MILGITVGEWYCARRVSATLEEFVDALLEQKRRSESLSASVPVVIDRSIETLVTRPLTGFFRRSHTAAWSLLLGYVHYIHTNVSVSV